MAKARVEFCGAIVGSVARRKGESKADAIHRAEATIQALLANGAKRLSSKGEQGVGPTIGLEPEDGTWGDDTGDSE